MDDLIRAYKRLTGKQSPYNTLNNYYNGDHPLMYSAERLRDAFERPSVRFIQNWCKVVVDAVLDRITFKGWDAEQEKANDLLDIFFSDNRLQILSHNIHRDTLVTGESFVIFDQLPGGPLQAFYNDSRNVHLFYDDSGAKQYAAKWWVEPDDEKRRLNLFYPDRIEKYEARKGTSTAQAFRLVDEVRNPFTEIPVIHFQAGYSELSNIITLQDAVNKLFSDMMVVGEFNAFRQRWMVTNADLSVLRSSPKSIFQLPPAAPGEESTQVGEFEASDLGAFLDAMDKLASSIAIISRTPKHYFYEAGGNVSGEALIVMEAPLVKKVEQIKENISLGWDEVAEFVLTLGGQASAEFEQVWEETNTIQPITKAQEMESLKRLGLPMKTILRRAGWDNKEIEQYEADLAEEKASQASETALLLEEIRRREAAKNDTGNL